MAEGPESRDAAPLLEKAYHDNCPGCKVDRLKRERRGIPYRDLSYIWIVSLCTALPITSLFPFVYFMVSVVTGIFILLNNAVPQHQRGAANGISMTAMSISKAFGPACGGALFSWAQKRQVATFLPGDQMVFFVLNLLQMIGLILTFKPFLAQPHERRAASIA